MPGVFAPYTVTFIQISHVLISYIMLLLKLHVVIHDKGHWWVIERPMVVALNYAPSTLVFFYTVGHHLKANLYPGSDHNLVEG